MIYRRKLYIAVLVLLVALAFVMITFIYQKGPKEYKGTLVNEYSQEAVV
jgi:hypothetical protein